MQVSVVIEFFIYNSKSKICKLIIISKCKYCYALNTHHNYLFKILGKITLLIFIGLTTYNLINKKIKI